MKTIKTLLLTTCFFAFVITFVNGQSFDSFFKYEGVKTLAELAHPTNTMQKGYYKIYDNAVDVEIYYTNGVYTYVRLWYDSNNWFNKVQVIKDTDIIPPFLGIEFMKNLLYEVFREYDNSHSIKSSYEKWLNKTIVDFTGKDMTLVAMTIGLAAY